ncbi:MFS transporter [Lichenicola cladoniae]|uniref:MFS transporter n=1 Tax=Lichenicola cladoniae TaxID=1484109 RepID=A0A6M8HS88_9PROT|nr:MFS transporter [Lichenicola cladoniae]NPD65921.1 MFS transporter [Acetobacteraceae bacterium]QKE91087.1 MFS transporter [Lichenicola cladoniae]
MSDMSRADDTATTGAAWGAVLSLSVGVFALVTAEFLPASLLTPMATDLHISYGAAGQAVTATALVAAVAAPAVVIGTAKIDRRMVVWGLSLLLVLSDLLAAAASNIWVLLLARVLLGVALGGTWSLAAALALRLVPARMVARAMSIIFTGVTAASVCAPALGAYLGDLWGWRATFLAASSIGIVALAIQLTTMPRLPSTDGPTLRTFFLLLRRPRIRTGLITVMFVISGHFAGFTYVRPFLEQVSRLDVRTLSMVLLAFGIGGFFGNFAGGMMSGRSPRVSVAVGAVLLAATAFALLGDGTSTPIAFVALAVWGFAFGVLPVSIQTWTTQAALDHAESAGALLVTTFQIAIATGAILGGVLVDRLGAPGAIGYCGVALLVGAATMLGLGRGSMYARDQAGDDGVPVTS